MEPERRLARPAPVALGPTRALVYPRLVQAESGHGETQPEERAERGDDRASPWLLIASIGDRRMIPLPAEGGLSIGRGRPGEGARASSEAEPVHPIQDELLSRRHLRIARQGRRYVVEDLGSRNGTFLDGRRLAEPAPLGEGSLLLFGNQIAVYRRVSDAARAALEREAADPFGPVPTCSPALAVAFARLRRIARTDAELLLTGETGTGKEVCARAVHRASGRRGPFVAVNCASLPAALVESELFGYVAGAHSTARDAKAGLVEAAQGGTLLLDEIGDMPADLQAKIFRFLQDRTISPLGSVKHRRVDVRVMAATARPAGPAPGGPLRADLIARLGADPVVIPPLRDRPEDIPALLAHFIDTAADKIEPAALRALCLYSWPLNVRELEKVTRNATALCDDRHLRLDHFPSAIQTALTRGPQIRARRSPRPPPARAELEHLLREHSGNVTTVARTLDRQWNVVWRWLVRFKLSPERFRKRGARGRGETGR
jgi:two-component system response regulator GlrR